MLENWLKPTSINFSKSTKYQFSKGINIFKNSFPDLKDIKIAILGIDSSYADPIREELYQLSNPFSGLNMVDIGNLKKSNAEFIFPVVKELLDADILPIILGENEAIAKVQYLAHKDQMGPLNMVVVSNQIAFNPDLDDSSLFLNDIFESTRPFHFGAIGCQRHFIDPRNYDFIFENNFDLIGLGDVRKDIESTEPIIRDADMVIVNVDAVKYIEAQGQKNGSPSGLSSEEICQICRYAGMSDKLTSIGFVGYDASKDTNNQTAKLLAQMVWYTLDGVLNRKNDFPVSTDGLVEYIVNIKQFDEQVTFWKSKKSGRWWIQFAIKTTKNNVRHRLIPCSYNDYLTATKNEVPNRLLQAYRRFA